MSQTKNYSFFQHKDCEYFPCHQMEHSESFNCLFCYCPLYALGTQCGGNFRYTEKGIKDCSLCTVPHAKGGYSHVLSKFKQLAELAKNTDTPYCEAAIRKDYQALTTFLIAHHMTISTMESATSGQIASLITDTEGSSAVLKGAFITYCNEAKILQGVPADILEQYTVYSKETAEAMAQSCAHTYGSDIGIGVTGTMGNVDPLHPEVSVPGQVYFAILLQGSMYSYVIELPPQPTRLAYKLAVAKEIYDALMLLLCRLFS